MKRHVLVGVTAGAIGGEVSGLAAPYRRHMFVLIVALQRMIAGRMAIHAPGVHDEFADFAEDGARALGSVFNGTQIPTGS